MTDKTNTLLPVSEAAREAAADYLVDDYAGGIADDYIAAVRNGECDDSGLLQAFARFEQRIRGEREPAPSSERELLREALQPFGCDDCENPVADENGWTDFGMTWCRERIVDWFGPSQFYRARQALATPQEPALDLRTRNEALEEAAAYIEGKGGAIPGAAVFASLVSGNNQPCMSGDPRDRLIPHLRRRFDDATRELAAAIRNLKGGA